MKTLFHGKKIEILDYHIIEGGEESEFLKYKEVFTDTNLDKEKFYSCWKTNENEYNCDKLCVMRAIINEEVSPTDYIVAYKVDKEWIEEKTAPQGIYNHFISQLRKHKIQQIK
jgi:hypothetical protein